MEKRKVYSLIDFISKVDIKSNVLTYFDIILGIVSEEGPDHGPQGWNKFKTRSGTRFVNEIQFEQTGGTVPRLLIPACFVDIQNEITILVLELLKLAKLTITDASTMIPLQLFLCYYRDGKDVCPMHSHKCRQITLSIGVNRIMTVEGKKVNLYNGSVIYLHTEKHGILKEDSNLENRLSLNLFYTTTSEMNGVR